MGAAGLSGNIPKRPELELLRPVRILGRSQDCTANQCEPFRVHLGTVVRSRHAGLLASTGDLRSAGDRPVLCRPAGFTGKNYLEKVLRRDGHAPLCDWLASDALDGVNTNQDVPALDSELKVFRRPS